MYDERFMREALALAEEAGALGEVPVGCVVTIGKGEDAMVVGRGMNRRESAKDALAHAELEAIHQACQTLGGWRLWQCELYVTLEPCMMCSGAISNAHLPRVYYGAKDPKRGAVMLFGQTADFTPEVTGGYLAEECAALLRDFFRTLRLRPSAGFSDEKKFKKSVDTDRDM